MKSITILLASFFLGSLLAAAQSPADSAKTTIYQPKEGIVLPDLQPVHDPDEPGKDCKHRIKGKVTVNLIVDAAGEPRNVFLRSALGNQLDLFALRIVTANHFRPATLDGKPVAVALTDEVALASCEEPTAPHAAPRYKLLPGFTQKFRAQSDAPKSVVLNRWQDKDAEIAALIARAAAQHAQAKPGEPLPTDPLIQLPQPVYLRYADFSWEDRKTLPKDARVVITFVVDAQGIPSEFKLQQSLGYGHDANVFEAVRHDRFRPAMHDGEPVAAYSTIEVEIRIY